MPLIENPVYNGPVPDRADIVIVGGGSVGLGTAYGLAKLGYSGEVLVFERSYLGSGNATRNAARFRYHFFSKENSKFAKEAIRRLDEIPKLSGVNIIFNKGGYLWFVFKEKYAKVFKKFNKEVWAPLGAPVRELSLDEVKSLYPYLRIENALTAFVGENDGSFHHDYLVLAMASFAKKHGIKIMTRIEVERIIVEGGKVKGVRLKGGKVIKTNNVVISAGVWSNDILKTVGIEVPIKPDRKCLLVTEPYRFVLEPLVILFEEGHYIGQTLKGEFIASSAKGADTETKDYSKLPFKWLLETAKVLKRMLKIGSAIRILRAWCGSYNVTPDHSHILGRDPEWPEGLYINTGYSGHGMMLAPYSGELLAKFIAKGVVDPDLKPYLPTRFKEGRLIKESLVIG